VAQARPTPGAPEVSVVVASHEREERLSTLLDALAQQTLPRKQWELIVVHTYAPDTAARLLDAHELDLRHEMVPTDRARPSTQRNLGWRMARAPLVAFTDDDCRPERDWLERLLATSRANPGAIVQGATKHEPNDSDAFGALHIRAVDVDPPGPYAQTCNILYERAALEEADGFDERAIVGEDLDLSLRVRRTGAPYVGARDAVVYHAVEAVSLREKVRSNVKWQHLAYVVKRNPELRKDCCLGVFYKREHFRAALALAGLVAAPRTPLALAAVLPYYLLERDHFGPTPKGRLRAVRRLPDFWLVEVAEIATFLRGSVRYRTLLL
jgi:GT2 family glycosyltransferase